MPPGARCVLDAHGPYRRAETLALAVHSAPSREHRLLTQHSPSESFTLPYPSPLGARPTRHGPRRRVGAQLHTPTAQSEIGVASPAASESTPCISAAGDVSPACGSPVIHATSPPHSPLLRPQQPPRDPPRDPPRSRDIRLPPPIFHQPEQAHRQTRQLRPGSAQRSRGRGASEAAPPGSETEGETAATAGQAAV